MGGWQVPGLDHPHCQIVMHRVILDTVGQYVQLVFRQNLLICPKVHIITTGIEGVELGLKLSEMATWGIGLSEHGS